MVALENYEIKETIHIGSEIEVYRGIDIKEKRPVIIKFVPKTDVFDHAVINLKNEFEIMKHLTSANMLKVYGLERKESGYTLLLEDTEGKSLKKVIQEGKLELESFFKIAIHLSEILYEIHRNKIIHKDIKTDNIIVNFSTMDTKIID
ncbi:MAG: protein kinase, partial [Leptospira sp.]|nr:protein kinase [Leptospira sp.]